MPAHLQAPLPAPQVVRRIRRKRHHRVRHGGAWKVAYADFVTAMMAFFMLLWLLSTPDKSRLKGLADYFSASISGPESQPSSVSNPEQDRRSRLPPGQAEAARVSSTAQAGGATRGGTAEIPASSRRVLADEMRIALDMPPERAGRPAVRVEPDRDGTRITLMDSARQRLFAGTTAQLTPYGRALIARTAARLVPLAVTVSVEGHTDSSGGARADHNWSLSSRRALAARDALLAAGLPPERIGEIVARAGTQPVYPDQPERAENRRIAIVALAERPALPRDPAIGP